MSLALLKQRLAEILDVDRPASPGLPTGVAALDGGLAAGGIPRGRLTEILGAAGSGKTTLVRRVVERAVAAGLWVAYVDATRTLAPRDWAVVEAVAAAESRLWVVRPHDHTRGAWCADVLLRSGAFGLVVLDGAPPLSRAVAVRLTRLARESDAALVVVSDGGVGWPPGTAAAGAVVERGAGVGGALRLRVAAAGAGRGEDEPASGGRSGSSWGPPRRRGVVKRFGESGGEHHRWRSGERRFVVAVEKGGVHQTVEVGCAIAVARRLCTHPEVPDRRGVDRGERGARGARVPATGGRVGERDGRSTAGAADVGRAGGGGGGSSRLTA